MDNCAFKALTGHIYIITHHVYYSFINDFTNKFITLFMKCSDFDHKTCLCLSSNFSNCIIYPPFIAAFENVTKKPNSIFTCRIYIHLSPQKCLKVVAHKIREYFPLTSSPQGPTTVGTRNGTPKVPGIPSAWGYSWATLSPGVINTER
jgi:hypothetical protein